MRPWCAANPLTANLDSNQQWPGVRAPPVMKLAEIPARLRPGHRADAVASTTASDEKESVSPQGSEAALGKADAVRCFGRVAESLRSYAAGRPPVDLLAQADKGLSRRAFSVPAPTLHFNDL